MRWLFAPIVLLALTVSVLAAKSTEEARQAALNLLKDCENAPDKVAFLIAHAEDKEEMVLLVVARELGKYDDPRVVPVLEKLRQYEQKDGELIPSISAAAVTSLERLQAGPDLKRLRGAEDLSARLKIARQYALGTNEYARMAILRFLVEEAPKSPKEIIPLLVEAYADKDRAKALILRYPEIAVKALGDGLKSPNSSVVAACAGLVGDLKAEDCLPQLCLFLCADRERSAGEIWLASRTAIHAFGNKAVPYLEQVLYSRDTLAQFDVVDDLRIIGSPEALGVLERFRDMYSSPWMKANRSEELLKRLVEVIQKMEKKP